MPIRLGVVNHIDEGCWARRPRCGSIHVGKLDGAESDWRPISTSVESSRNLRLPACDLPIQGGPYFPCTRRWILEIQYYSCFLSYSVEDRAFAERLYRDLVKEGVRCWFAQEELKTGEVFPDRIKESIRANDKLLLVLSKNSLASHWVKREVEIAQQKERQTKKLVLFPIRLDDGVMDIKTGWPADIRRSRQIADFTAWESREAYNLSIERLLCDLRWV